MAIDQTRIAATIAVEIAARPAQVATAIGLIDEGATIPFIARYRKEATGGLDDTQLRKLEERLVYLRDLEARRETVRASIAGQGKLTDDLARKIGAAATKADLEDLYRPFKPKRRSRAEIARERGLQGLADALLADRALVPQEAARPYLNADVADLKAALDGARDILIETFAETADLVGRLRAHLRGGALIRAALIEGKAEAGAKFSDYFDHSERWAAIPSHRALALLRGRNEEVLTLDILIDADDPAPVKPVERMIAEAFAIKPRGTAADAWLMEVVRFAWRMKLAPQLSSDLMGEMRDRAEAEAIQVFAHNLKDLLLAAPAGSRPTMGLDPGNRTGVKVAIVDGTGKVLETATIYPFQPRNDLRGASAELLRLIVRHRVDLIAIGNGTASRETEKLVADLLGAIPDNKPTKVIVSEAGASVYSASALAADELPGLDVSLRGAVSIARRLQDPLAELVKIDPKSIGVGQYQHDVDQGRLGASLGGVIEDAVNAVGVDLNTASAPLLARVSGLGPAIAEAIVAHRNVKGAFRTRRQLLDVARLGNRTFELCAGFLRISGGDEPLDASAVHPEAYGLAKRIVAACGRDVRSLMGDSATLKKLDPSRFADERFGLLTVRDIIAEFEKPGRDPRPAFKTARFADGVDSIKDLMPGMRLEGTVTNVANFGAFVDIGVHQDGLVHVSQIADRFVKDPRDVVRAGDVVSVRVVEVDLARKRIALSMRKDDGAGAGKPDAGRGQPRPAAKAPAPAPAGQGAFGAALAEAFKRR